MKRLLVIALLGPFSVFADEEKTEEKKPSPPKALATLDVTNSGEGSIPGGSTRKEGKWAVDASAKKLELLAEPLVDGWLEFGPEIREKGATLVATGRAPGKSRLQSWIGIALYGTNGFQLRWKPVHNKAEIVRRGIVLTSSPFASKAADLHDFELWVRSEGDSWIVEGRIWKAGAERPDKPLVTHRIEAVDLLFPLAGRPGVVGVPFSGEPVQFAGAKVFGESHDPRSGDDETSEDEPSGDEE